MVTKFPVLQQLHFGETALVIGFSFGMMPNFVAVFKLNSFPVLLKTIMTDFYKSFRQNMHRKTADKLFMA